MKKLLIVLLALGMVLGFSMSAAATDVSVSGTYRIVGWYDNNSSLNEDSTANAFYRQRLRVSTVFQVAEGLKLTTRFDALEQRWGEGLPISQNAGSHGITEGYSNDSGSVSFEQTQLDFTTPYGLITAGIYDTNTWGLDFGNNSFKVGRIVWKAPVGPVIVVAGLEKDVERDAKPINGDDYADADGDAYILAAVLQQEGLTAGLLWKYVDYAQYRDLPLSLTTAPFDLTASVISPYVKATFGPAYVEAQLYYAWGTMEFEDNLSIDDQDLSGMSFIVEGKMDVGPGYVGGLLAYAQGDDPATTDETEGSFVNGGWDWNPCLVLFNDDMNYRAGGALGHDTVGVANTDGQMTNAWLYQIYAGMSPMENLTIRGSLTFAYLDEEKMAGIVYDDDIGHEVDLQAAYKVFDNLEYSVGFGYFWAGDFYKGDKTNPQNIDDDYLLVHKLQLTF